MKEAKCKIHTGHRSNIKGKGDVVIEISDVNSGLLICEVIMNLAEYGEMIAGSGFHEGLIKIPDNYDLLGKKKEIKYVHIPKEIFDDAKWNEKDVKEIIADEWLAKNNCYKDEPADWEIWDYGFSTQQRGDKHSIVMCRYVKVRDESQK